MQVISDSAAESEAAAQHDVERGHVAVPVTANLEQVYKSIKVNSQQCVEVCCLSSQAGVTALWVAIVCDVSNNWHFVMLHCIACRCTVVYEFDAPGSPAYLLTGTWV